MANSTGTDGQIRWTWVKMYSGASGLAVDSRPTSVSRLLSAGASVNATVVKATSGTLFGIKGYNARGSAVYLKLYNMATSPAQTDTPLETIYLPASLSFAISYPNGLFFSAGIAYRMTTAGADNDTGALTAADILALNVEYA